MKLSRVYREICLPIQATTGRPTVIAGGAVRDHLVGRKPKDYDVFVLSGKLGPPMVSKLVKQIREAVLTLSADTEVFSGVSHLSFPAVGKYDGHSSITPIAEFNFWTHKVQIMVFPGSTVESLLNSFDYPICCVAYKDYHPVQTHWNVKKILRDHGYLLLNTTKLPAPQITLRRGYDFAARYGLKLSETTVKYLCSQIASSAVKPAEPVEVPQWSKVPHSHSEYYSGTVLAQMATALGVSWK